MLVTEARDAGIMAIAGPVRGTVRVLYARNGSMVLLREIRLPVGTTIRELSLSADGGDLFIGTGAVGYAVSTRTGRIEAWGLAGRSSRRIIVSIQVRGDAGNDPQEGLNRQQELRIQTIKQQEQNDE